jgi:hypothetical protein
MRLNESTFVIKKENTDKVLKALKNLSKKQNLKWVDYLKDAETIEEAFDEIRYDLELTNNGDYAITGFSGEKLGDDFIIFQSIAKFVQDGTYIEMVGEDGDKWRWVFKNGICKEIYSTLTWEE